MGGEVKALLQLANFTLDPSATLNTEIHTNAVRIQSPNSVNASKRKRKNQINHNDKQKTSTKAPVLTVSVVSGAGLMSPFIMPHLLAWTVY